MQILKTLELNARFLNSCTRPANTNRLGVKMISYFLWHRSELSNCYPLLLRIHVFTWKLWTHHFRGNFTWECVLWSKNRGKCEYRKNTYHNVDRCNWKILYYRSVMAILWLDRPILLIALDKVAKLFRGFLRAIRTSQLSNMLHKKSILWKKFCHVVKNVKRKVFFRMASAVGGTELLMTFNLLILPTFRFSTGSIQWRKTDEFWLKNSTVAASLDRFHEAFQSRKCLAAEILRRSTSKKNLYNRNRSGSDPSKTCKTCKPATNTCWPYTK